MTTAVESAWETVIGLEVHVQLSTASKMYCSCAVLSTQDPADANTSVCPVCLGHPGTLPRPNHMALVKALTLAQKAGCDIQERCTFSRKNYFYPDLPKGYQISQFDRPLAWGGAIPYWHLQERCVVRLVRIHVEEDTAKLFHQPDGTALLDFNRGGVPLLELVTQPDFRGPAQCVSFLDELRSLLRRLGVSDAAMESGNMRCEPNVSVRPLGSSELRTKTELKNLNSFATLRKAVESEVARQIAAYEAGETIYQETMRWDEARGMTVAMRRKETADDYRYFDDPDIPALHVTRALLDESAQDLRASSYEVRRLMVDEDGISHVMAAAIADDSVLHRWYRLCCQDGHTPRTVANWVTGELTRLMREAPLKLEPGELSELLRLLGAGRLTQAQAKTVFEAAYLSGKRIMLVIEELGIEEPAAEDIDALSAACRDVIAANPKVVEDIRGGKASAVMVLVGQVMKATRGSADPSKLREILEALLAQ